MLVIAAVDTEVLVQGNWSDPFNVTDFNKSSQIYSSVARINYIISGQYTCLVYVVAKNPSPFTVMSDLISQTMEIHAGI